MFKIQTIHAYVSALAIFSAVGFAQEPVSQRRTPQRAAELERTPSRRVSEPGLKGTAERPAAARYSGVPEFSDVTTRAKQGRPDEQPASDAAEIEFQQSAGLTVESPRFAVFEAGEKGDASPDPAKKRAAGVTVEALGDSLSHLVYPIDGSTLGPVQTFEWSHGRDASGYFLRIGSCPGCSDLLDEWEETNLSRSLTLPIDGRQIYVILFTYYGGDWYWIEYQFRAWTGQAVPAQMISPTSGATLTADQEFRWDRGAGAAQYYLRIGSCTGCYDLLNEDQGTGQTRKVRIPSNGQTIYVRLFSRIGEAWWYHDYQYRAPYIVTGCSSRVNVTNKLGYPVEVAINGGTVGSVQGGRTAGTNSEECSITVSWTLVQPTLHGRALGDPMGGTFSKIDNPRGTYNFVVDSQVGANHFFWPLITNRTSVGVAISVNGGLQAQNNCNCVAPGGTARVGIGYYRFYSNSNLRLYRENSNYTGPYRFYGTDADGRTSPGGPMTNFVDLESGEVELIVTAAP